MSSTRFLNAKSEYNIYKKQNECIIDHLTSSCRTRHIHNIMPNLGIYPSHVPNDILYDNAVDIESKLYGIGSSDMERDIQPCIPINKIKQYPNQAYFQHDIDVILPDPLIIEKNQRPIIP